MDKLLEELNITRKEFAEMIGVHINTVSNWKDAPPKIVLMYLSLLTEVRKLGVMK